MHIYKTTTLINGKIYIGQEKGNNDNYLGSGKILKLSIKKYGVENFKKEILQFCFDQNELNEAEIYWINNSSCLHPLGYNICVGNFGGDNFTNNPNKENIRIKISQSSHGWIFNNWSGRTHSEYSKEKMSNSKKGKASRGVGWHHSTKTKQKISEKFINITYDEKYGIEKSSIIKNKLKEKSTGRSYDRIDMCGENNPAKTIEARKKISDKKKELDKIKMKCEYCNKEFTKPNFIK
jgi:group I intron endonuclease